MVDFMAEGAGEQILPAVFDLLPVAVERPHDDGAGAAGVRFKRIAKWARRNLPPKA